MSLLKRCLLCSIVLRNLIVLSSPFKGYSGLDGAKGETGALGAKVGCWIHFCAFYCWLIGSSSKHITINCDLFHYCTCLKVPRCYTFNVIHLKLRISRAEKVVSVKVMKSDHQFFCKLPHHAKNWIFNFLGGVWCYWGERCTWTHGEYLLIKFQQKRGRGSSAVCAAVSYSWGCELKSRLHQEGSADSSNHLNLSCEFAHCGDRYRREQPSCTLKMIHHNKTFISPLFCLPVGPPRFTWWERTSWTLWSCCRCHLPLGICLWM